MSTRIDAAPLRAGTLYSLLAVLATVLAPHAARLPVWVSIVVPSLLAWRFVLARRDSGLPARWLLMPLVLAGAAGVLASYGPSFGRDASVALLALMLGLKALELRTVRDAAVVTCLGFFLIITDFLYSQTIPTAVFMLFIMAWLTATLISCQDRAGSIPAPRALRSAGTLMLQAAPLMVVLFLLFPRVQGPIFGFPMATSTGVSGLSDSMSPGSLSRLGLSDEVAFRVQFHSAAPPSRKLYWRGPVLWDFDGRTWSMGSGGSTATGGVRHTALGSTIDYTVTLEAHNMRWVFAIDLPAVAPRDTALTADYQLLSYRPVRNRMRYETASNLEYRYGLEEKPATLARALKLPRDFDPKSMDLARRLRANSSGDRALIENTLDYFRTQPFFYTLEPPPLGRHSVDEFLFETRRGFCEHYASAFVFLMRAGGVPARVVTGYQGGELNPLGDYLIVRQSEAHAWAEVWLQDAGWVRVDPTAAVSPARIQVGISAAVPASDPLPLSVRGNIEALRQLALTMDAVANAWNQWVLGYTPERQLKLLEDTGLGQASWQTLTILLMIVAAAVIAIIALVSLRQLHRRPGDPVARVWRRFCSKLMRVGSERRPAEGPLDFAQRAGREQPALKPRIDAIATLYLQLRYGGGANAKELSRLRRLVRAL